MRAMHHVVDRIICNQPSVILGDFNVDLLSDSLSKTTLLNEMKEMGFVQIVKTATTDYNSVLDHIYTNIPEQISLSGVLESYFSDRKPVFACLQ